MTLPDHVQAVRDGEVELNRNLDVGKIIMDRMRARMSHAERLFIERERQWARQATHGRWVVIAPPASRAFRDTDLTKDQLELIDDLSRHRRRGRRFSSLSRARSFAREVGGDVRRWRARQWREVSPWAFVGSQTANLTAIIDCIDEILR